MNEKPMITYSPAVMLYLLYCSGLNPDPDSAMF